MKVSANAGKTRMAARPFVETVWLWCSATFGFASPYIRGETHRSAKY